MRHIILLRDVVGDDPEDEWLRFLQLDSPKEQGLQFLEELYQTLCERTRESAYTRISGHLNAYRLGECKAYTMRL